MWSYLLFCNACWYIAVDSLNVLEFDDKLVSRLLIDAGMFLITAEGWFDLLCTYAGM